MLLILNVAGDLGVAGLGYRVMQVMRVGFL